MGKLFALLQKLSPREQFIAWAVIAALVVSGGVMLHDAQQKKLLALKGQLDAVKNEIGGLKSEVLLRQKEVDQAAAQQVEAKTRATLVAQTQQQLSQGGRVSELVSELMRTAKEGGVDVLSIKPGEQRDQGSYVELPVTMELRARFRSLGEYLQQVQHLQQVVLVGRVRVEPSTVEGAVLTVEVGTVSFLGKV
ncbi:MAG: type 4a pilus biogenesis protein PilO [Nitrospirae bacterium]|nr:type 4a pilus biogenesis protein PilO [Nitrospirota bacterium]